jgi:hypothetical protein
VGREEVTEARKTVASDYGTFREVAVRRRQWHSRPESFLCPSVMPRLLQPLLLSLACVAGLPLPLLAQVSSDRCLPLKVIGGSGTTVSKQISPPPGVFVLKDNWNTDFAVPENSYFKEYLATITPTTTGDYQMRFVLKYADGNEDRFFDQRAQLRDGLPFTLQAISRPLESPSLINLFIGGTNASGSQYELTLYGCN